MITLMLFGIILLVIFIKIDLKLYFNKKVWKI